MADDTIITSLNFNSGVVGKSVMDQKNGVHVLFGYISGLPEEYDELLLETRGMGIALEDKGITQDILDKTCQKLTQDCRSEGLKILITKSDLPFDRRWFIIGDIKAMLDAAAKDRLDLPVSNALYGELLGQIERFK